MNNIKENIKNNYFWTQLILIHVQHTCVLFWIDAVKVPYDNLALFSN